MAKNKETEATTEPIQARQSDEPVYTLEEIVEAAKIFKVQPELAYAALSAAHLTCATKAQAQRIIDDFKNKKVK